MPHPRLPCARGLVRDPSRGRARPRWSDSYRQRRRAVLAPPPNPPHQWMGDPDATWRTLRPRPCLVGSEPAMANTTTDQRCSFPTDGSTQGAAADMKPGGSRTFGDGGSGTLVMVSVE